MGAKGFLCVSVRVFPSKILCILPPIVFLVKIGPETMGLRTHHVVVAHWNRVSKLFWA